MLDTKTTTRRHRFEPASDTRLLYALLSKAQIGEVVTYEQMSKQLDRRVTGSESYLQSALRMIERDDDKVFASVRGVGYKRLSDSDIATTIGVAATRKMRRAARRTMRTLAIARDEHLNNNEIISRNTALSFMGALHHMTKAKTMERLETAVRANAGELAIGSTLEAFK